MALVFPFAALPSVKDSIPLTFSWLASLMEDCRLGSEAATSLRVTGGPIVCIVLSRARGGGPITILQGPVVPVCSQDKAEGCLGNREITELVKAYKDGCAVVIGQGPPSWKD